MGTSSAETVALVQRIMDAYYASEEPRAGSPGQRGRQHPARPRTVAHLGRIDAPVVSVSTGDHSPGFASVLPGFFPRLRVVGVDTRGSSNKLTDRQAP